MPVSEPLYNKAKELKNTIYPYLRTVTLTDTLMPEDYNNIYNVLKSLLESVSQPVPIPYRVIKMKSDVYSNHVNDFKNASYSLWNYINTVLGEPYIYDSDFMPLKNLLDSIPIIKGYDELSPFEWNSLFDFCRRIIDLILRYPPVPPYLYIWWKDSKLYSGIPPDDLYLINSVHGWETLQFRRINSCWFLYGKYWIVYYNPNDGNIYIKTSTDLKTWSSPMTIDSECQSFEDSLLVDNILYVVGLKADRVYLYKVELHEDGTISVTTLFNFGCSQYPNLPLRRCGFSIRGDEMWFYYSAYDYELHVFRVYRRVSYYPFNQPSTETYIMTVDYVTKIKMINGASYLFAFVVFTYLGGAFIRSFRYDGTAWVADPIQFSSDYMFPFNWNNVTYYVNSSALSFILVRWTGTEWAYTNYSDIVPYEKKACVVWILSTGKVAGALTQYNTETSKYRVQYFEIKSDLSIELKEATDWLDYPIYPYSVKDRKNSL
ncbi:MAG: hypothetical protein QXY65_02925 [Candidatus Methanomethylicaceae archaeon]